MRNFAVSCVRAAQAGTLALSIAGCAAAAEDAADAADAGDAMEMGENEVPICTDRDRRGAKVDACARFDESLGEMPVSFSGEVMAIERPERLCGGLLGNGPNFNPDEQGYALTVSDGEAEMTVTLYLPWKAPLVQVGDTVGVEYDAHTYLESPPTGSMTLRDEDGELLFWVASAYTFDELDVPELSLRDGEPHCKSRAPSCADVLSAVIAESGDSGDVPIAFGEMADVGDYVVLHGDNTLVGGGCPNVGGVPRSVTFAAVRGSMASLAAREADAGSVSEEMPLPECSATQFRGPSACVQVDDQLGATIPPSFTAVVEAIATESIGCSQALGNAPLGAPPGHSLTLSNGEITAKVIIHSSPLPVVRVGDTVTLEYEAHFYLESPSSGSLRLRNEGGELLFWLAMTTNGFSDLEMPELVLRAGEATCQQEDSDCSGVTQGKIDATSSDASSSVTIGYGETATVGEYTVLHGGNTTRPESCAGSAGHYVSFAAARQAEP